MAKAQNVTITVDEDVARWARVKAAERDTSVSRMVGDLLAAEMRRDEGYDRAMRRYLAGKPRAISDGRPLPSRDEIHDRTRR